MAFARNQHVRIHYRVEGEGPPLLLHHGTGDDLRSWHEYGYAAALRQHYRLILLDARGHGQSDKPHDPAAYTLANRVSDVVALLDDLGLGQVHYFGVSLGGWVGWGMLRHATERIRSLTICGAQPYGQSMEPFRRVFRDGLAAWVALLEGMSGPVTPERRQRLLGNDLHALRASVANDRPDIVESVKVATQPCLLLAGTDDPHCPAVERIAGELPNASFAALPGLNHIAAIERSDLVLPHVLSFLASVSADDGRVTVPAS